MHGETLKFEVCAVGVILKTKNKLQNEILHNNVQQ